MSNETPRFNPGLNVIDLDERRKNNFNNNFNNATPYEMDKFTMTWENLGLSHQGTLQIDYLLKCLENITHDNKD